MVMQCGWWRRSMSKVCRECGSKCCTYFCFEIDKPDSYEEFEDIRWYLCHKGISVHVDEGSWFICIDNRCKNLRRDNSCAIYFERPLICRSYDPDNCDHSGGDYGYKEHFRTPEQLNAYARKTLGAAKYETAQRKARAKFEPKPAKKTKKTRKIKKRT